MNILRKIHELRNIFETSWPHCFMLSLVYVSDWSKAFPSRFTLWFDRPKRSHAKVHGANMGRTWVLLAPDGPNVGPMDLAIRKVALLGCSLNPTIIDQWGETMRNLSVTEWFLIQRVNTKQSYSMLRHYVKKLTFCGIADMHLDSCFI